jgi:DNA-binding protein Fis
MKDRIKVGKNVYILLNSEDHLDEITDIAEKYILRLAMERCKGNQVKAAEQLGISRGKLRKRLRKYFDNQYFRQTIE